MLEVAADPGHPDHTEVTERLDDCDPKTIDELQIKIDLGRIAKRRSAAKARFSKQPP
jgi:hypothetical protein